MNDTLPGLISACCFVRSCGQLPSEDTGGEGLPPAKLTKYTIQQTTNLGYDLLIHHIMISSTSK